MYALSPNDKFRVVVAGGGVAGLEATLALRALAGDSVEITLITPEAEYVCRAATVQEPFSYPEIQRYSIADIASHAGARLLTDNFRRVDLGDQTVHTTTETLPYDALILALGATRHPLFPRALTLDDRRLEETFHTVVEDVERGNIHSLVFLMPADGCWPVPLYELALMTAERAYDSSTTVDITIVTPERQPLEAFGPEASLAISALLAERGISIEIGADPQVPTSHCVVVSPGGREIEADLVIALPELVGPGVRGLHSGEGGFVPVDRYCRVKGAPGVFAVGDVADFHIKHGGLAGQQADVAASAIAQLVTGAEPTEPFNPVVDAMLLTGRDPLFLRATVVGVTGFSSQVSAQPIASPATKISARYLNPYLRSLGPQTPLG